MGIFFVVLNFRSELIIKESFIKSCVDNLEEKFKMF